MIRLVWVCLSLSLILAPCSSLLAARVPEYQAPVNDYADIIEPGFETEITKFILELREKTGVELAVLTIRSLEGESADIFALNTFTEWGLGNKEKNDGLLLLLSLNDRRAKIEVGYGLEGILPDGVCGAILDRMVPFLQQKLYGQAVYSGVISMINRIAEEYDVQITGTPEKMPTQRKTKDSPLAVFIRTILLLILIILLGGGRMGLFTFLMLGGMHSGGYWSSGNRGGFGSNNSFGGFGGLGGGGLSGGGGASRSW